MKNILIINQPLGNRGDESAHRALVRTLRDNLKECNILVLNFITTQKELNSFMVKGVDYVTISQRHRYRIVLLVKFLMLTYLWRLGIYIHPLLHRLKSYYVASDIVICAPGGICMGGFKVWWHVYLLLLAKYFKKPLVYYSRSFGPFDTKTISDRIFKRYSERMLRSFDFLSIRDAESMRIAEKLNVNYISSIDTAFLETPCVGLPKHLNEFIGRSNYCVLVPNSLTWHYKYKDVSQSNIDNLYIRIMKLIHKKYPNIKILLLPQLCDRPLSADYPYFCKLKDMSKLSNVLVLEDIYSSDIQQTIIEGSQFVIGARYHSIVFSINNGVNFISLSYEHKMKGLLEVLDLSKYEIDISKLFLLNAEIEDVMSNMEVLFDDFDNEKVKNSSIIAKQIASHCMTQLLNVISKW